MRYPMAGRALAVAALTVAAAMAVAACSSTTPPVSAPESPAANQLASIVVARPAVATIPKLSSTDGLRLPIEAYRPTAAQQDVVDDAVEKLIVPCMAGYGLTYVPTTSNLPEVHETTREYGVGDLATAQKYGYHSATQTFTDKSKPTSAATQSAGELLVLTGSPTGDRSAPGTKEIYHGKAVPAGGCSGQAQRAVTGVDDIDPTSVTDLVLVEMWKQSQTDSRVVAAIAAWSACMKQAGYTYASPLDPAADPAFSGPTTSMPEITTAVADMRCKQSTNLIGIWFTVESAYENAAIAQHLPQVTAVRDAWARASLKGSQLLDVKNPTP